MTWEYLAAVKECDPDGQATTWKYDHEVWAGTADSVANQLESDGWLKDGYPDLDGCMVRVTLEWWRPIHDT